jgi:hypothetical protein
VACRRFRLAIGSDNGVYAQYHSRWHGGIISGNFHAQVSRRIPLGKPWPASLAYEIDNADFPMVRKPQWMMAPRPIHSTASTRSIPRPQVVKRRARGPTRKRMSSFVPEPPAVVGMLRTVETHPSPSIPDLLRRFSCPSVVPSSRRDKVDTGHVSVRETEGGRG